ncbi:hypothetical protein GP486_005043 [Trichoglossum hirsutum]|uniref:Uncharacterized protein n=1 Tax=Trichoglossum hirsutum TaxID=265104 RepID=A0A9P8RN01_9PEZI|nr:hypothetical protein GP486_005043 [Trichoglossum hirsutum]
MRRLYNQETVLQSRDARPTSFLVGLTITVRSMHRRDIGNPQLKTVSSDIASLKCSERLRLNQTRQERRTSVAANFGESRSNFLKVIAVRFQPPKVVSRKMLTRHEGVVMGSTDKTLPQGNNNSKSSGGTFMPADDTSADEDNEQPEEIRIVQQHASFNEIVVWGHEALPDTSTDPYFKGMEEWIAFAEQVG